MPGRQREFSVVVQNSVGDWRTTTGAQVLNLCAPTEGAILIDATFTTLTVGVGSGTYDSISIQESGTAIALTNTSGTAFIDADAAIATIHGTLEGNGTPATAQGTLLEVQVVVAGTITTGTQVMVSLTWFT